MAKREVEVVVKGNVDDLKLKLQGMLKDFKMVEQSVKDVQNALLVANKTELGILAKKTKKELAEVEQKIINLSELAKQAVLVGDLKGAVQYTNELRAAKQAAKKLLEIQELISNTRLNKMIEPFKKGLDKIREKIKNLGKSSMNFIKTLGKWTVRSIFLSGLAAIRNAFREAKEESESAGAKFSAMNSILVSSLIPITEKLAAAFQKVYIWVSGLLNALFGFNPIQKAIDSTKKKIAGIGKTAKKAGKQVKQGLLSTLDEITNIEPQSGSGGAGGGIGDMQTELNALAELEKMLAKMNEMDFGWAETLKNVFEFLIKNKDYILTFLAGLATAYLAISIASIAASVGTITMLWPILAVIAAVTVIILLIMYLVKNLGNLKEAALAAWEKIKEYAGKAWEKIKQFFANIGQWFKDRWNDIINGAKELWEKVKGFFSGLWEDIKNIFKGIGTWFAEKWNSIVEGVKKVPTKIYNFFKELWDKIVGLFSKIGTKIGEGISGAIRKALNTVIGGAVKIINGFIKAINLAIKLINKIPGVNIKTLSLLEVPSFDVGTPFVPRDMIAQIHKGERIVPAKYNHDDYMGGSQELVAEVRALREDVRRIEINPYTTIKDVGSTSVNYINQQKRILGREII